jgi:periplasmic divalent cation tolerance protein
MTPVIVLTTVGADFDAASMARQLVEARLAACVNIVSGVESVYRWEGRVAADAEKLLVIKTAEERVLDLQGLLFRLHPYEVPEFVVVSIEEIRGPYLDWLTASL